MYRTIWTPLFAAGLFAAVHATASAQVIMKQIGVAMPPMVINPATKTDAGKAPEGDEGPLRTVGISLDDAGLLNYFRLRSQGTAKPERLAALIEQLGDKSPLVARKASGELAAIGAPAIPALRQAVKDPDQQQTAAMAQRCLEMLEQSPGRLSSSAARLVAQRRPKGAAEVLLTFLPYAEDDGVIEEVRLALLAVSHPDGKADPALIKALRDASPIRRALAIDTLCQNGLTPSVMEQVPLRELLQDPKATVRLRAALALTRARDPKAVSTLITLLTELPVNQARQAEEYLTELAGDQSPKTPLGNDMAARQKCRDAWATWWQASEDSNRLLEEVRKRTVTEPLRQKCEELIAQLGDTDFNVREKAETQVKSMGALIVPLLRQAATHQDLEIRKRALACLAKMTTDKNLALSPITTRLIALRKPPAAVPTLLAYVPYADDETILQEVQLALNVLAIKDGKPDPALVRALTEEQPARRAAAAEALCLGGDREHLAAIRKLLSDEDSSVRLKVGLALAGIREKQAIDTLIELLGELPAERAEPAEEYLLRMAGERAPLNLPIGDGADIRKKRRSAWADWWKANGERVALVDRYPAAGTERYLGHILLVIANSGQVMEYGTDRKIRWQIGNLMGPRDVQVLGNDRILIAEFNAQRVSERNRRGDILWQKMTNGANPLGVQRLRNGHTFITCANKLMEVDRSGNEIFSINRPNHDVIMARRLRDGQIIMVNNQAQCIRMDTTGKQLKSFGVQMAWQNGLDILDNGHVLIPATWMNKVLEYDAEGKVVADINSMQPMCAARLRNGNLLVGAQVWPAKIVETDPSGKQVSEIANLPQIVYRVRTR
jgi:HEAT repeat protein